MLSDETGGLMPSADITYIRGACGLEKKGNSIFERLNAGFLYHISSILYWEKMIAGRAMKSVKKSNLSSGMPRWAAGSLLLVTSFGFLHQAPA